MYIVDEKKNSLKRNEGVVLKKEKKTENSRSKWFILRKQEERK